MIKLKTLIEMSDEIREVFEESPMRISGWTKNNLETNSGNYATTEHFKENGKLIDSFGEYDIYEMVKDGEIHHVFINDNFISIYFKFDIDDNNIIIEKMVWQNIMNIGLMRKVLFEYYLKKYNGMLTDNMHSELGEKYCLKILKEAKLRGFKIYLIDDDKKIPLDDVDSAQKYFSSASSFSRYRFLIER